MTTRILDKPPVPVREFGDLRSAIHSRTPFWVAPALRRPDVEPAIAATLEDHRARNPAGWVACTVDDPLLVYLMHGSFAVRCATFEEIALAVSWLAHAGGRLPEGSLVRDTNRLLNTLARHPAHINPVTAFETRAARGLYRLARPETAGPTPERGRKNLGHLLIRELAYTHYRSAGCHLRAYQAMLERYLIYFEETLAEELKR
jgi:hypothetical protein